uniref:Uncharacterized protein n=1 Tax=Avena sativa TaxID=4498 RepID=A0ACD5U353_AVESA
MSAGVISHQTAPMARDDQVYDAVRRRVVLFPLPFQGHISPMLHLAELLHARGLAVTVLHTDFNAPDPARHPEFAFVPIRETLPDGAASPETDIVAQLLALNGACEAPFREALASLLLSQRPPDVACVVVDGQWYTALGAASGLGLPVLTLRTESAATFRSMLAFPRLRDAGYLPIKEERLDELVAELEPLRARDLIRIDGSDEDALRGFIARVADAMRVSASGVVLNTFDAIEGLELAKIQDELSCPAFAVGPLHRMCRAPAEHSLHEPDRGCLAWLDAHPPRSVLYVSLGSVASVDPAVFEEMAWGLASSGVPFLWVVRPGSVHGTEGTPRMPDGVGEEVRSRGKVVTWAPQREVLAHEAIGAFWSHCGWNSTLESVCEGVPVLAQPCFADQTVNARYLTHQWGVGLELGDVIERATVAETVRMMMTGKEGDRVRERARQLKLQADQCVATSLAIDDLAQYMLSM